MANIELPKDAEGREIPLDTVALYDDDGYFHCSSCGWDGRLWEYIGFGDMVAYEPVRCPKCGEEIKR